VARIADRPSAVPALLGSAVSGFVGRQWLVPIIHDWLFKDPERFLVIVGSPGTGKTAIAAWLVGEGPSPADPGVSNQLAEVREVWGAAHFCSRRVPGASIDPRSFIRNVAGQLAGALPSMYEVILQPVAQATAIQSTLTVTQNQGQATGLQVENLWLGTLPVPEAFDRAIRTPLEKFAVHGSGSVALLVDALDESLRADQSTIADLVASLAEIPGHIKVLLTTKPDRRIINLFPSACIVNLDSGEHEAENKADLTAYVHRELGHDQPDAARELASAAKGNFMYAQHVLRDADPGLLASRSRLPESLSQLYYEYLRRLIPEPEHRYRDSAINIQMSFVGLLSVTFEPITIQAIGEILGIPQTLVNGLADELEQVIAFVDEDPVRLQYFHSSMADFVANLATMHSVPNPYFSPACEQHQELVASYIRRFGDLASPHWENCDSYGLQYLAAHISAAIEGGSPAVTAADLLNLVLNPVFVQAQLRRKMDDAVLRAGSAAIDAAIRTSDRDALMRLIDDYASSNDILLNGIATTALVRWYHVHPGPEILMLLRAGSPQARRVAVNAAYRIGLGADLIAVMARDKNDELQQTVAYMANLEWSRGNRDAVTDFADRIADGIQLRRPVDAYRRVRFLVHWAVFAGCNYPSDPEVIEWIDRSFYQLLVTRLRVPAVTASAPVRRLISLLAGQVFSRRIAEAALSTNLQDPREYFRGSRQNRELLHQAAKLVEPTTDWTTSFSDIAEILRSDVVLVRGYGGIVSCANFLRSPEIERAAELLRTRFPYLASRTRLWLLLSFTVLFRDTPELQPLVAWQTKYILEHDRSIIVSRDGGQLRGWNIFLLPLGLACGRAGQPMTEVAEALTAAINNRDQELVAALTESLGLVGFYYPRQALPLLRLACLQREVAVDDVIVGALSTVAVLHPEDVDMTLRDTSRLDLRGEILAHSDVATSRLLFDRVGFFSLGVYQTLRYPIMREALVRDTIEHMANAKSPQAFARRVTRTALQLLHDSNYHIGSWTGTEFADR
jgi:hypothetical protein